MWLLTNFGFFSIVQKPEDIASRSLTIRSRVKGDLETLREKYLPQMGEILKNAGSDYKYRARVSKSDLAIALLQIGLDIDYSNFKNAFAEQTRPGSGKALP